MRKPDIGNQDRESMYRVIISGIGTGGHYFPALVVAREFMAHNIPVIFLARKESPEQEIALRYGIKTMAINPKGFFGKSLLNKIKSLISMLASIVVLGSITRKSIGIAFGGYGAIPLVISCMINRRPFFLFEPNRVPGRATRLFAGQARAIFLGLGSERRLSGKAYITGIPVRPEFKHLLSVNKKNEYKTVLFYGGSQGSRFLNQAAIDMQNILPDHLRLRIVCGKRDYEWVRSSLTGSTTVIPFTQNPWNEINNADVIVSRAGALAGYEIAVSGRPVIFVPFPYAIDRHQYYNAQYFAMTANAVLMEEKDLTVARLLAEVEKLHFDAQKAKAGLILDAESRIYRIVGESS